MTPKITPVHDHPLTPNDTLTDSIALVMRGLSASSRRVYRQTYENWIIFCQKGERHPLHDLTFEHVGAFLDAHPGTKATQQRRLSALRRLVETIAILDYENPKWDAMHAALKRFKITSSVTTKSDRTQQALSPRQVYAAFDVWAGDKLVQVRNRALLAVAFYAGLRRSEMVALHWTDIDLESGLVSVQAGKGDKDRTIPFASDQALPYLFEWHQRQTAVTGSAERKYVFCGIRNRGNGELLADKPMSTTAVYQVMQKSGGIAPHDARRTLLTDILNNGGAVSDAQFIAGHANPQTTLRYAKISDAKEVKGRIKTSY
jgi:site-specific recombinase XerD